MANEDLNLVNETAGPQVHNTEKKPDRKSTVGKYKGNMKIWTKMRREAMQNQNIHGVFY